MKLRICAAASALTLAVACGSPSNDSSSAGTPTPTPSAAAETPTPTPTATPTPTPTPTADPKIEAALAALPAPYNEANYSKGRRLFRQCQTCHMIDPEAGNLVGPNLHGIFGRQTASTEGFSYSKALREADFEWTAEQVDHWLENPRSFLPGNKMSFAGYRKPDDRRDVIAYMLIATAPEAAE